MITILSISSCTIQKRLHNGGYHIEWRSKQKGLAGKEPSEKVQEILVSSFDIYPDHDLLTTSETNVCSDSIIPNSQKETPAFLKNRVHDRINSIDIIQKDTIRQEPRKRIYPSKNDEERLLYDFFTIWISLIIVFGGLGIWFLYLFANPLTGIILLSLAAIILLTPILYILIDSWKDQN